jgi:hypothetical protein
MSLWVGGRHPSLKRQSGPINPSSQEIRGLEEGPTDTDGLYVGVGRRQGGSKGQGDLPLDWEMERTGLKFRASPGTLCDLEKGPLLSESRFILCMGSGWTLPRLTGFPWWCWAGWGRGGGSHCCMSLFRHPFLCCGINTGRVQESGKG